MLYLASRSPRRNQLLQQLGIKFQVIETTIDETAHPDEPSDEYVRRIALAKARAGGTMIGDHAPILAADTAVVVDNHILGKPSGRDDAIAMLTALSGRSHQVYTAVAFISTSEQVVINRNRVWFRTLTAAECEAYCDSGEPYDKAGAYGIQGRGAAFVTRLEGSFTGVMGLPLTETVALLSSILPLPDK